MHSDARTALLMDAPEARSETIEVPLARVDARTLAVLRLSALLMVVWGTDDGGLQGMLMALCAAMLAYPSVLLSPVAWGVAAATQLYWISLCSWDIVSQHKIFILYWISACGVALCAPDPSRALRSNGRYCLAALFGLAAFWKLAGGEYFDGGFFEFLELWREELAPFIAKADGMSDAATVANYDTIALLRSQDIGGGWLRLRSSWSIAAIGLLVCWGSIVGEVLMAASFVFALPRRWQPLRDVFVIGFVLSVDVVFPYTGFAFAILLAGLAQAPATPRTMPLYLGALAVHTILVFLAHGQPLSRSIAY